MEYKVRFRNTINKIAKIMPFSMFIAATLIPGGYVALGIYLTTKSKYDRLKKEKRNG
jgi:hypothetical protein